MDSGQVECGSRWRVKDLPFEAIDHAAVRDRDDLFLLVCAASFIESGSDLYAGNLAELFEDDPPVCDWLRNRIVLIVTSHLQRHFSTVLKCWFFCYQIDDSTRSNISK